MEKDSFEDSLRNKILQAEETLNSASDKERVWSAIQKRRQSKHWLYYAAVITFIMIMVGVFYAKEDKLTATVKIKKKEKLKAVDEIVFKESNQNVGVKQLKYPVKQETIKQIDTARAEESTNLIHKSNLTNDATLLKVDEITINMPLNHSEENAIAKNTTTPATSEFTVQFKRGKPVDEVEKQTKEAISRLKKIRFSKDTAVYANINDKQKGLFKIKF